MNTIDLSERIEQLFSSQPRNGADATTLWHKRAKIEKGLSQLLKARSQNICIDGPWKVFSCAYCFEQNLAALYLASFG